MDVALHKEQDDTLATVVHGKDTNIAKSASKNITRQRSPKGKEKETQIDRNGGADRFTTLSTIHEELLVHICRYLTPASILRLARTSSYFYHITGTYSLQISLIQQIRLICMSLQRKLGFGKNSIFGGGRKSNKLTQLTLPYPLTGKRNINGEVSTKLWLTFSSILQN